MKNFYTLKTISIIIIFLSQLSQAQDNIYRVAVLPFEVTDLTGNPTNELLGEALTAYFPTPIQNSQKFELVNRSILNRLIDEISLSEDGLTSDNIKRFGELYSVDIFIDGRITVERQGEKPILISANFTETLTAEVRASAETRVTNESDFQAAVRDLITAALPRFPLRGSIFAIDNGDIYINLGSVHGLTPKDTSGLIFREKTIIDRTINEQIGSFEILNINRDISTIAVSMNDNTSLEVGDIITIEPLPLSAQQNTPQEANLETSANTNPEATETNNTTESEAEIENTDIGFIFITGSPDGANIYFDDELIGQLENGHLQAEVTAKNATLSLEADGYESQSKAITISANGVVNETINLLRSKGQLTLLSNTGEQVEITLINEAGLEVTTATIPTTIADLDTGIYTIRTNSDRYEAQDTQALVIAGDTPSLVRISLSEKELVATLNLNINPNNLNPSISLNSTPITQTNTELKANTDYTLSIIAEGYEAYSQNINLAPNETQTLDINLNPLAATLTINTIENAVIRLNGDVQTETTLNLTPNTSYTLELSAEGFEPYSETLNPNPGEQLTLNPTLTELPEITTATLRLTVLPNNATVTLNGEPINATNELTLEAGVEYTIEASAEGYENQTQTVALINDQSLELRLNELIAQVTLMVTPEDAEIALNGNTILTKTLELSPNTPHTITITAEGYLEQSQAFTLSSGEQKTLSINLEPELVTNFNQLLKRVEQGGRIELGTTRILVPLPLILNGDIELIGQGEKKTSLQLLQGIQHASGELKLENLTLETPTTANRNLKYFIETVETNLILNKITLDVDTRNINIGMKDSEGLLIDSITSFRGISISGNNSPLINIRDSSSWGIQISFNKSKTILVTNNTIHCELTSNEIDSVGINLDKSAPAESLSIQNNTISNCYIGISLPSTRIANENIESNSFDDVQKNIVR